MKPWNSAYRNNVKEIVNWIKNKQLFPNVYLEGYSNEWIGCDIICKIGASHHIVIWCCTGEYTQDRKSRPFYVIRYEKNNECNRYTEMFEFMPDSYIVDTPGVKGFGTFDMEVEEISHYFVEFFELSKDIGYKNAGEYIDKQTKLINEELKISKDFV